MVVLVIVWELSAVHDKMACSTMRGHIKGTDSTINATAHS